MRHQRRAGVLLPISSLPSTYGIGTLGQAAYDFVDFLQAAKQSLWQILPIGPTTYGDSPYQSPSAFAGNPYFIDLDILCEEGLLTPEDCRAVDFGTPKEGIDYGKLYENRLPLLRKAFEAFEDQSALEQFWTEQAFWLDDYVLYQVIKDKEGSAWLEWPDPLRLRDEKTLQVLAEASVEERRFYAFVQYLFFQQWDRLKQYANERGVELVGDCPIYVALDSADVWSKPELFQLTEEGRPKAVAGVPPDAFSESGQLWGNPLYDWAQHQATGYEWWLKRLAWNLRQVDHLRLDHFRGLEAYFSIPSEAESAVKGQWELGPGLSFIEAVETALPEASLIAEDLGVLTKEVEALLERSAWPGMNILHFAFDGNAGNLYLPHNCTENRLIYTGTHDNTTTRAWIEGLSVASRQQVEAYTGLTGTQALLEGLIRMAYTSVAKWAIVPVQDWLGLGEEARINAPSTTDGRNWRWRLEAESLTLDLAERMAELSLLTARASQGGIRTAREAKLETEESATEQLAKR